MTGTIQAAPDVTAVLTRLYDLEVARQLEPWLELWDDDFEIVFPFATDPARLPVRGKDRLRSDQVAKFDERARIELRVEVLPLADPLRAVVKLDVRHVLSAGGERKLPVLCIFTLTPEGRILRLEEYFNEVAL